MIKKVESKKAAIFNNDNLMIIKTMLSAVIDTLCLTVIHLRKHPFK